MSTAPTSCNPTRAPTSIQPSRLLATPPSSQSGASRRRPFPARAIPIWPAYTLRTPAQAPIDHDREHRRDDEREDEEDRDHGVVQCSVWRPRANTLTRHDLGDSLPIQ